MTRKWMHFLEELAVFALRKVFICISRGVGISQPPRTPSISSPCGSLFCHSVYWVLQRTWQTANLWWKVCVDKSWLYNINICWVDASVYRFITSWNGDEVIMKRILCFDSLLRHYLLVFVILSMFSDCTRTYLVVVNFSSVLIPFALFK